MADKLHADAEVIERLGGPAEVARMLGGECSVQRVYNWRTRGIPPLLKYQRTDVFGPAPATDEQEAA